MRTYIILLILAKSFPLKVYSQIELLRNGSFSDFSSCPNSSSQINYADYWNDGLNGAIFPTSDFYHCNFLLSNVVNPITNPTLPGYIGLNLRGESIAQNCLELSNGMEYQLKFKAVLPQYYRNPELRNFCIYVGNTSTLPIPHSSNLPYDPTIYGFVSVICDSVTLNNNFWRDVSLKLQMNGDYNTILITGNMEEETKYVCIDDISLVLINPTGSSTRKDTCINDNIDFIYSYPISGGIWNDGTIGNSIEISDTGFFTYKFFVNCSSYHIDTIYVELCDISKQNDIEKIEYLNLFVPNAFTPNNDFVIKIPNYLELFSFSIFDRWGKKLFNETNQRIIKWDGMYKGKMIQQGGYSWVLNYKLINQPKIVVKTGFVIVLK